MGLDQKDKPPLPGPNRIIKRPLLIEEAVFFLSDIYC